MALTFIRDQLYEGIEVQFYNKRTGNPIDLTGGSATFLMSDRTKTTMKINSAAVISDAVNGKVQYNFTGTDLDTEGNYLGQFTINGISNAPLKKIVDPIVVIKDLPTA